MAEMIPLRSSNVSGYSYDDDTLELHVWFNSGSEYVYQAVPRYVADGLGTASSPGRYLNEFIKDAYDAERVS